jgi:hypothetical protein
MWYRATSPVYTGRLRASYRRFEFWAGFCYVRGRRSRLWRSGGGAIEQCKRLGDALSAGAAGPLVACAR